MPHPSLLKRSSLAFALSLIATTSPAQVPGAHKLTPNLPQNVARPLRYHPDGPDFVIVNGGQYFNRPLYGGNTAFRVDAGDKPEFSLYLPGRGGNLRFGVITGSGALWLDNAKRIEARYRPGEMRYRITDAVLGSGGSVELVAIALNQTDGLIVKIEPHDLPPGAKLVWAYGGANGQRGRRDGDIGTESVPISQYFQLQPRFCRGDRFAIHGRTFVMQSKPATIVGLMPAGSQLSVADANNWTSCQKLMTQPAAPAEEPVITGQVTVSPGKTYYVALQRTNGTPEATKELKVYRDVSARSSNGPKDYRLPPAYSPEELPAVFAQAENYFSHLRNRVSVDTPDPWINAAAGALNIAADAVWDAPQQTIMHGAIAWRIALLGWRGPYTLDTLGWHGRARRYLTYWARRQNTDPIPAKLPPPDEKSNLARSETALHSNGDLSDNHYDMNLVYMDVLFRHILWTGDMNLAQKLWPVIVRHLAWERRLFRREFGPDKLPLYEAYADIWASDDLEYEGGGVAYASAYNYFDNTMAARLAKRLGKDPTPYETEAKLIARAMRKLLWMPHQGMFAEYKDLLGEQLVHPSAGLWSFYHTVDSGLPTEKEALDMTRYVDRTIPHLPIRGSGVPDDDHYHVLSTTDWMPYSWSVNNVVFGENMHTALAYWQAHRPREAFRLMKSAILASMYMGICPGNVGTMDYLDVYRRESQRDFADGSGIFSRALVEGLFGIRPDLLDNQLRIEPGFPDSWTHASIDHPNISLAWRRNGLTDSYNIQSRFGRALRLIVEIPARTETATVSLDGKTVAPKWISDPAQGRRLQISAPMMKSADLTITWSGPVQPRHAVTGTVWTVKPPEPDPINWQELPAGISHFDTVDLSPYFNDKVTNIFKHAYRKPRSPYCSLAIPKQGIGGWAGEVNATANIDDSGLRAEAAQHHGRLILPNGVPFTTPGPGNTDNILFTSQWNNFPDQATIPLSGRAKRVYLLMAGSTNWMQSRLENGCVIVTYSDGTTAKLALRNPTNWWPIDQDYFIDDYQFARPQPIPPRVDLKTGHVRFPRLPAFFGKGGKVPGGAATVLNLQLDPAKKLKSLTVQAEANEVVIGLMATTLAR